MTEDRMMKWFAYEHLPEHLREISQAFCFLAREMCHKIEPDAFRPMKGKRVQVVLSVQDMPDPTARDRGVTA